MSQMSEEKLTDHAYDGIMEYDNPTPGWWTWIFVATIIFSAIYFLFVTLAGGQISPKASYDAAEREMIQKQYGTLANLAPTDETVLSLMGDAKWQKVGGAIYATNCAACHGRNGEGVTAPNLTDDHYLWVQSPKDIIDVIANGRKNGAMPGWKNNFKTPEILVLSSYVASLRGKTASGRTPEGDVIPAWKK